VPFGRKIFLYWARRPSGEGYDDLMTLSLQGCNPLDLVNGSSAMSREGMACQFTAGELSEFEESDVPPLPRESRWSGRATAGAVPGRADILIEIGPGILARVCFHIANLKNDIRQMDRRSEMGSDGGSVPRGFADLTAGEG